MKALEVLKKYGRAIEAYCLGYSGEEKTPVNMAVFSGGVWLFYKGDPRTSDFVTEQPPIDQPYPGGPYKLDV